MSFKLLNNVWLGVSYVWELSTGSSKNPWWTTHFTSFTSKKAIKGEISDRNLGQCEYFLTWMLYCMMTDHLCEQIILFSGHFRGKYCTFHHNIYPTALVNSYKIHECEEWLLLLPFILIILRFVLPVARNKRSEGGNSFYKPMDRLTQKII